KKLRADVAQDELDDADHEHEETDPAPLPRDGHELFPALPGEEAADEGHHEAMRVVRVVPPLPDEISEDRPVERAKERQKERCDQPRLQAVVSAASGRTLRRGRS